MAEHTVVVWLRDDLRLTDQPALEAARQSGAAVVPVFVWAPEEEGAWAPGGASRWWLQHALASLGDALARCGSRLIIGRGATAAETLLAMCRATGARTVYASRRHGPVGAAQDARASRMLAAAGLEFRCFGVLLYDPDKVRTGQGTPYQVFTPFWRACLASGEPRPPTERIAALRAPARWPDSVALEALGLLPKIPWDAGLARTWKPGEAGARQALRDFADDVGRIAAYPEARDLPAEAGTSRLSPYLHFGELSPHMVWHAVRAATRGRRGVAVEAAEGYLRQLVWREFAQHLLEHFPQTAEAPLRPEYMAFPWRDDAAMLRAWQRGRTGYPIVDAGMRQLWETGWMHNRVRMIVASFLVKDLLIRWQAGAAWFWDTLVDADLANNTLGWQWAAGCGADAAPYFRIFNPVLQGEKFDARGAYVRRYVPELARVPDRWIHQPWMMPGLELRAAGVTLGREYPEPVIGHTLARMRALAALARMRGERVGRTDSPRRQRDTEN